MIVVLVVHAVLGALLFPTGTRLGRRTFLVAGIAPLTSLVWLATQLPAVLDGRERTEQFRWVPQLGLAFDLRLDGFSALMMLLVSGIGLAICVYSAGYFSGKADGVGRTAGLLTMFAGAMLVLVLADNLLVLYMGWELTSVSSYLLIGNDHTKLHARAAALHALLVASLGGLVMLAGFVLLGQAAGTYRLSVIVDNPPTGTTVSVAIVLILVGAFTKLAQYPFHSWLPGAMAAPTPVSAYLHSATMVKAGVYLVARLAPAFASVGAWRPLVLGLGTFTMIAGGLRALRQHDLKLMLAFGTVSQLGFLMVLFGAGTPEATAAGATMLVAHALFKAALFMSVGTVDRLAGTCDLRRIPDLGRDWRAFRWLTIASAASMAGVPLLFGFIGKEAGFAALREAHFAGSWWALAGVAAGSVITVGYTWRFVWGMFGPTDSRIEQVDLSNTVRRPSRPPQWLYVAPIALLSALSILFGIVPALLDTLETVAGRALDSQVLSVHLAIWHGVSVPLALSVIALVVGSLLFTQRRHLAPVLATGARVPTGTRVYLNLLRGTNVVAHRVTGIVQSGSLPVYAGVTLLTAAAVPGLVLMLNTQWPGFPKLAESPAQVMVVGVLLAAALATAAVRRRFSAALFLGTVGYEMAGLFVVQGAPDLALTQVAIETLSTVLFVLVLRRLPDRFERTSTTRRRVGRLVISVAVGAMVFAFAIVSRAARTAEPVSTEMIERAYPDGRGKNVVNVILVDIRGLDTMAEITVLAAAAIGAVALARTGRKRKASEPSS